MPDSRLRTLYTELYRQGRQVLAAHNPCRVQNGKCTAGTFCCTGCEHLGPKGCTVQALTCKLWLCYTATGTPDGLAALEKLRALHDKAEAEGVPLIVRGSKRQSFIARREDNR